MLNNDDRELLITMVKHRLESLIIQRSAQEKEGEHKALFDDEIEKLYRLLAKLIMQTEAGGVDKRGKDIDPNVSIQTICERVEFVYSLRRYWSSLSLAVNSAIQYTRNDHPQIAEYDRICSLLSHSIDELRMFYMNIKKYLDDQGLYPFEPIKNIYNLFASLGYATKEVSARSEIREQMISQWISMREPLLSAFNRAEPQHPVSPFIRASTSG